MFKALLALIVLVGGGYVGYIYYGDQIFINDEENLTRSFDEFYKAVDSNNKEIISKYISPDFADEAIGKTELTARLFEKRVGFKVILIDVGITVPEARLSYRRNVILTEGSSPITTVVTGELWGRDEDDKKVWRLLRLAANDKYMRGLEGPPILLSSKLDSESGSKPAQPIIDRPVAGDQEVKLGESGVLGEGGQPSEVLQPTADGEVTVAEDADKKEKEASDKADEAASDKDKAKSEQEPLIVSSYRYSPVGKRDPFQALIDVGASVSVQTKLCEPERPRGLLETFDLTLMKLTGVIKTPTGYVALVETPDGKGYTVKSGMYMGKNCGLITAIAADSISVRELVKKPGPDPDLFNDAIRVMELRP